MNNTYIHLNNLLFGQLEKILDQDIHGDELREQIDRGLAANDMAKTIVTNGALMVKAAELLSVNGYQVDMNEFPILPIRKVSGEERKEWLESLEKGKKKLLDARTNREAG